MKTKIFLPLLGVLFLSQAAMAQFHIGIKGGANITKIDGKSFKDEFRYGYHLGAFMELGSRKLSINPEVLFSQYTTTLDSNFNHIYQNVFNPSYQKDVKLNYLTIPIVINYRLIGPLSLQAGPQFGVLIDQHKTILENGGNAFKHGDFAVVAGAQLRLAALRVTGRYVVGLNNINDIDNQDKWKNQGFQLSLGFAL